MLTTLAVLTRLIEYEASFIACARREIRAWAEAAAAIPDPALRRLATDAIETDASNAEAAAAFAVMAPRRWRRAAVELLVVHQILLDYVDMLGEQVAADRIERGLAIGRTLTAAITTPTAPFHLDVPGDDGGYLARLVAACRSRLWQMPAAAVVEQPATIAAIRCAEGLAYTHTAAHCSTTAELHGWAMTQPGAGDYAWWETAAGGNSNLAILALLAAATDPSTTPRDAAAIAAAYWPHVCVMSTLFDSLVDYELDTRSGNFSFASHYPGVDATRDGLIHATQLSLTAVRPLRHSQAHTMIVSGVAGYYAAGAEPGSLAAEVAPGVVGQLGRAATPIILALRGRHRRSRGTRQPPASAPA